MPSEKTIIIIKGGLWLAAAASVIGVFYTIGAANKELSLFYGFLIALSAVLYVALFVLDIWDYWKNRIRSYEDESEIKEYLWNWISKGGQVVIFTHDMSWACDEGIKKMLFDKARMAELSIILPKQTALTCDLENAGANIYSYESINYVPQSRFTIIHKDRFDAQVAIGRKDKLNGKHIIEEFALGEHPVFAVANDLVEIVKRIQTK